MLFYIIGGAILLAVILVACGIRFLCIVRKDRRDFAADVAVVEGWIKTVMSMDSPEDIVAYGDTVLTELGWKWRTVNRDSIEGYDDGRARLAEAKYIVAYKAADEAQQIDLLSEMLYYGYKFPKQLDIGFAQADIAGMINDYVDGFRARLVAGEDGSVQLFNELRHRYSLTRLMNHGVDLSVTKDWNQLVAWVYETPSVQDFAGFNTEQVPGWVRARAAEALRMRSLIDGKVVLAYCSIREETVRSQYRDSTKSRWPYRNEIGDVLLADVAKMVDAIHAQERLFVQVL